MRFWFIDLPAQIVGFYLWLWRSLFTIAVVYCMVSLTVSLALYCFGIRWGW